MSLRDEIRALDPALVASNDHAAIADALSVGRKRLVKTEVGEGAVSNAIGAKGPVFIYKLRQAALATIPDGATAEQIDQKAAIDQAWRLLDKMSLDVALPSVRTGLDNFAAIALFGLTSEEANAIKALAEQDNPVPITDVAHALELGV